MKKKPNLTILLSAIMMISLICGTALAKQPAPPPPAPVCGGLTGTWHGTEPGDMIWLALHTSDSLDPAKGEMLMNWTWINPNLIGGADNSLTPGHGAWQLNDDGMYDFTWYAYVIDSFGTPFATLRVSGVASFNPEFDLAIPVDCTKVWIYYEFAGVNSVVGVGELDSAAFYPGPIGLAYQSRVPMVVTPLPQ
jgi:hypothetical protein